MSCNTNCCTFLRGEMYIADSLSSCASSGGLVCASDKPLKKMGNIESATISISSQILGSENRHNNNNNKPCTRIAIQGVDISLTLLCTKNLNMKLATQSKDHVGDFMVGYAQEFTICSQDDLQECNFFKFNKSGFAGSLVVLLLDEDSETLETLTLDIDYSVSQHGIELLHEIINADAKFIRLTYNYDDRAEQGLQQFNFLSEFQGHKYLYFKGTNFAEGLGEEDPFSIEIYRVLFNPVSQLDLISNGSYFVINLVGRIEKHFENEDDGLGGYFKIRRGKL